MKKKFTYSIDEKYDQTLKSLALIENRNKSNMLEELIKQANDQRVLKTIKPIEWEIPNENK